MWLHIKQADMGVILIFQFDTQQKIALALNVSYLPLRPRFHSVSQLKGRRTAPAIHS